MSAPRTSPHAREPRRLVPGAPCLDCGFWQSAHVLVVWEADGARLGSVCPGCHQRREHRRVHTAREAHLAADQLARRRRQLHRLRDWLIVAAITVGVLVAGVLLEGPR